MTFRNYLVGIATALAISAVTDNTSDAAPRGGGRGGGRGSVGRSYGGSRGGVSRGVYRGGAYRGGAYRGGAYRGGAYRGYGNRGYGYRGYGRPYRYGYGGFGWGLPFWGGYGIPYLYGGYTGPDYIYDAEVAPADVYDVPPGYDESAPAVDTENMKRGRLVVEVPEGAEVWVENKKSTKTGPERVFRTQPMPDGWRVTYRVRARWETPDGETVDQKKIVSVPAGKRIVVDFTKPTADSAKPTARRNEQDSE